MSDKDITELLHRVRSGDSQALNAVIPLVYDELKRVASRRLSHESTGKIETTALVHETYVKLSKAHHPQYQDRAHFFAIASSMMRQILVDHARNRKAKKRRGFEIEIAEMRELAHEREDLLLSLDDALNRLAETDLTKVRLIEMRYFCGMTAEESAEAMHLSVKATRQQLRLAHAWLHRELTSGNS